MSIYEIDNKRPKTKEKSSITTKQLVMIGMLGAISTILMLFEFLIPFTPTFVRMDFSELPIILGGFMIGPLAGFLIIVVKIALNLILNGTTTMGVGELDNMIGSVCYMIPSVLLYRKLKSRSGAVFALVLGTIVTSVGAIFENMYLIFPVYAKLYGM